MDSLAELFEKKKDDFNDIYFCPRKNKIFLVESVYILVPQNTRWARYADKSLWGKDKKIEHCKTWQYIGKVNG